MPPVFLLLVKVASVMSARINDRFTKPAVSMLAPALWLMMVLLSPFDAYLAAGSIADQN